MFLGSPLNTTTFTRESGTAIGGGIGLQNAFPIIPNDAKNSVPHSMLLVIEMHSRAGGGDQLKVTEVED